MPLNLQAIDVGSAPGDATGDPARTAFQKVNVNNALIAGAMEDAEIKAFVIGCTGKGVDIVVEDKVESLRMPYAFVLLDVQASVDVAPVGADIVIDVNEDGYTILGTAGLVIPDGSETSTPAPEILSYMILEQNSKITIDVIQVGSTTPGEWLKVSLIGFVIFTSF